MVHINNAMYAACQQPTGFVYQFSIKKRGNLLHPLHQCAVPRGKRLLRIKTYNWTKKIMGFPGHSIAKKFE